MKRLMMVMAVVVSLIGAAATLQGGGPRFSRLFGVLNQTPHKIYIRIGFNKKKCAAMTKEISPDATAHAEHRGCYATIVSGYIYIDGNQVDLVRWEGKEAGFVDLSRWEGKAGENRISGSWVVEMNPDGKTATVYNKPFEVRRGKKGKNEYLYYKENTEVAHPDSK